MSVPLHRWKHALYLSWSSTVAACWMEPALASFSSGVYQSKFVITHNRFAVYNFWLYAAIDRVFDYISCIC